MKPTQALHEAGQSLWLDNITRGLLDQGTLHTYIEQYSITGLTSNPTIFDKAIEGGSDYDAEITALKATGASDEQVFSELALNDLRRAADLFAPVHEHSDGVDGWVSLEVSPLLAHDSAATITQATSLHAKAARPNVFIKIPGTPEGLPAIEECTFAGIAINVTLLFSPEQYLAAAEAHLRGVERRVQAGLNPAVASVGSVFVSRWDTAVADRVPAELRDRLGIAEAALATAPTGNCSTRRAGGGWPTKEPGHTGCCGPARRPRIPTRPTCSTSARWPPRSPSTPCPRRPCTRSSTTDTSAT